MKQRTLSLVLAAILAVSTLLSGCGNETNKQESQSSAKESQSVASKSTESQASVSTVEESELEEKTIQIWLSGVAKQKDADVVWEKFNEMLQEYVPNTTVEFSTVPTGEYKEKFNQMLASKEPVDLAWAGWVIDKQQNADDGNLMPLDDLLAEYGQGIIAALGDGTIIDMHRSKTDGKAYFLNSWQGLFGSRRGWIVPTELAKLAGDTWLEDTQAAVTKWVNSETVSIADAEVVADQLEKYFAACKDAGKLYAGMDEGVISAYALNRMSGYTFNKGLVGIEKGDNEFKVVDLIDSEQYRFWAEKLAEFYKKGYIRSDIASSPDLNFVKDGVFNDNTLIMDTENDYFNTAETMSKKAGVEVSVIRHQNEGVYGTSNSTGMVVPYCADEPERAIMVLDAIYTVPELYQLLIYGIEGVHYKNEADGTIKMLIGGTTNESDYGIPKWIIGTCMNSLVTETDTPGYYEQLQEQEKTAMILKTSEFVFDNSKVEDIIIALSALEEEYYYIFGEGYAGDDWEKVLNEYVAARKEAGIDKYIAECQKQFDAWRKENNYTSWDQLIIER